MTLGTIAIPIKVAIKVRFIIRIKLMLIWCVKKRFVEEFTAVKLAFMCGV